MPASRRHPGNPTEPPLKTGGFLRTLLYLPIIHTPADMGALKESVVRTTHEKLGRLGLARKVQTIDKIWTEIERVLDGLALNFAKVRLYQDGLPVCGREAEIVAELARAGNRNHQLLRRLMEKGATLMGTESGDLLVQEYQLVKHTLTSRAPKAAALAAQRRALSESLLKRRDQFIADRINETLKEGETGILFMGMLHAVERFLPKDIKVIYPLQGPR